MKTTGVLIRLQYFILAFMSNASLTNRATLLAWITLLYNLLEGVVSLYFGIDDETLALAGFGLDSFIECLSALGILHMLNRFKHNPDSPKDAFEIRALKITGTAFFLLAGGLILGGVYAVLIRAKPDSTLAGILISVLSIATMYVLYRTKLKTGQQLGSQPIISDAKCTKACFYLSFVLLASSLTYQMFHIPYVDALGGFGIAWYAWKEGRESFEKAKNQKECCC